VTSVRVRSVGGAAAGSGRVTLDDHGRHPGRRSLVAGDVQVITI